MTKFQNNFQDYDLFQTEDAKIDNFRKNVVMGITIIEHEDLIFGNAIYTRTQSRNVSI